MFGNSLFNRRFNDLFRQVEREMADVERRLNALREQSSNGGDVGDADGPFVYGWTVQVGPDGEPRVRTWGNTEPGDVEGEGEASDDGWREPFVTTTFDEDEGAVRFTAELPGIEKEDIHVETSEESVLIEADGDERRYRTELPVDVRLDPETASASYNNGILEVHVGLHEAEKDEGRRVPVK